MINGMTGFGSATFSAGTIKGLVEVRSVNHRYLDMAFFLPMGYAGLEERIRALVQKNMGRGRVTVDVKFIQKQTPEIVYNKTAIRRYLKIQQDIRKEFGLKGTLALNELIRLPGVVETQEEAVHLEKLWPPIEKSLAKALGALLFMRKREGQSIHADIKRQLSAMSSEIKKIQVREKKVLAEKKKIFHGEDFESFQKSIDINEEISRLSHHIDEVGPLLSSATPVGKKIDFIAQEMQRETNTIGSKLQDRVVSSAVVALKSRIEKLREQAQNIE